MNQGWIKLHRTLMDWEWYDDIITRSIFIHCLLRANHTETKWRGIELKRGQFVTSLKHLADENGVSVRTIRTHLKRLKATNELTVKTTNKYSIITVCKYASYQSEKTQSDKQNDKQNDNQTTRKRQSNDNQTTTDKNEKNKKNVNNEKNHHQPVKNDDDDFLSKINIEKLQEAFKTLDVLKEVELIRKKVAGQTVSVPENYVRQCLNNIVQKKKIVAAASDDYRHFDPDTDYAASVPDCAEMVSF